MWPGEGPARRGGGFPFSLTRLSRIRVPKFPHPLSKARRAEEEEEVFLPPLPAYCVLERQNFSIRPPRLGAQSRRFPFPLFPLLAYCALERPNFPIPPPRPGVQKRRFPFPLSRLSRIRGPAFPHPPLHLGRLPLRIEVNERDWLWLQQLTFDFLIVVQKKKHNITIIFRMKQNSLSQSLHL